METLKTTVKKEEEKRYIQIMNGEEEIVIPLTEDNPNEVKKAFNKLIKLVQVNDICLKMEDCGEDLFSQIASEYITQLNRELKEVRQEMLRVCLIAEIEEADVP